MEAAAQPGPEARLLEPAEVQNQSAPIVPTRNNRYFLHEDPMAVFKVEDQLFKVHQYHLARESKHFREMFAKPSEADFTHLPGVTVAEFESLLDYYYAPRIARNIQASLDLLSISHRFRVDEAFRCGKGELDAALIRHESALAPLEKLVFGDRYGFQDWASSALNEFLERKESLSVEEAMALGFDRLAGFVEAREEQLEGKITKVKLQEHETAAKMKLKSKKGKGKQGSW